MIDDNTKFEALNQKVDSIEKTRQKFFTVLLVLPLLFYLLKNSIIEEINFSLFSIKQVKILLLFFPTIYSLIFFYLSVLTNHSSKVIRELNYIASGEKDAFKQYEKESWLGVIQPVNILGNVLGSIRAGGCIGCVGALVVFFPILTTAILYPLLAFCYSCVYNWGQIKAEFSSIAIANLVFSAWLIVALVIYIKSAK